MSLNLGGEMKLTPNELQHQISRLRSVSESVALRRSGRINRGQPPTRYGEWLSGSVQPTPSTSTGAGVTIPRTLVASTINFFNTNERREAESTAIYRERALRKRLSEMGLREEELKPNLTTQRQLSSSAPAFTPYTSTPVSTKQKVKFNPNVSNLHESGERLLPTSCANPSNHGLPPQSNPPNRNMFTPPNRNNMNPVNQPNRNETTPPQNEYYGGNEPDENYPDEYQQQSQQYTTSVPPQVELTPRRDPLMDILMEQSRRTKIMLARQSSSSKLPTFDGNPLDWPLFYSHFKRSTEECDFSPSQNMDRLEQSLRGEALKYVRASMIVRDNTQYVMKRLEERFGRPEYIIQALTSIAKNAPVPRENKLASIIDYSSSISNLVTTVETLNLPTYLQNPQLMQELIGKLPDSLKLEWGRTAMLLDQPNLKHLAKWIDGMANAASYVTIPNLSIEDKTKKKKTERTESSFATSTADEKPEKPKQPATDRKFKRETKCHCCGTKNMYLLKCPEFKKKSVDERWEVIKSNHLCFKCFSPNHSKYDCKRPNCPESGCNALHSSLLHSNTYYKPQLPHAPSAPRLAQQTETVRELNGNHNTESKLVKLRVLPVTLYGPKGQKIVNALLDDASTVTMLCDSVATELGLSGQLNPLRLTWTNGTKQEENASRRVTCQIGPVGENTKYKLADVRTVKNLNIALPEINQQEELSNWPHLTGVKIKALDQDPKLIIGEQHIHLTVAREIREGNESAPIATRTKLGWVLHGPVQSGEFEDHVTYSCIHEADDDLMYKLIKESFTLESIGIQNNANIRSREDKIAEKIMNNITKRVGNRWETGLLWRGEGEEEEDEKQNCLASAVPSAVVGFPVQSLQARSESSCAGVGQLNRGFLVKAPPSVGKKLVHSGHNKLPPSYEVAYKRLQSLERKMKRFPVFQQQLEEKIKHYIDLGYARKLTKEELAISSPKEWYLPIFTTTHPNKPGKIRLVWDAASKSNGSSLNDFLYTVPDLLISLPGVLLKFRQRKIAFSGDITEMFHQIKIRPEDCPAQRFLWRTPTEKEPSIYQLEVMMFGSVCSPFCAQYVKNRNATEFAAEYPEAVTAIVKKHYQDDYLDCRDTVEEATKMINQVTEIHRRGGFHIGKWVTNSPQLMEKINPNDRAPNMKDLSAWSEIPTERALGMHWNPAQDFFTFKVNLERAGEGIVTAERIPTKRAILRLIMLIWDPLGFLSHYVIRAKILQQKLWRKQLNWDDEIPHEEFNQWRHWVAELPKTTNLKIQRCLSTHVLESRNVQLHIFCDASEEAYCCVAYLRISREDEIGVNLIMAKARVAPLKPATIHRLELQAALTGARMGRFIEEQLEISIHSKHHWTDSMTVLKWLRSEARRFQQFVSNRLGEIQEISNIKDWHWLPSKQNVADDGTRNTKLNLNFAQESRWFKGPDFLYQHPEYWPVETVCNEEIDENYLEYRKEIVAVIITAPEFPYLPEIERFSRYVRLLRSTARVFDAAERLKTKKSTSALPMRKAEVHLIRRSQWQNYTEEMNTLTQQKPVIKKSKLFQLNPILDHDGVLRMCSRLAGAENESLRMPIILHPKDKLTIMIIMHYHVLMQHGNASIVHNELRQKYWIPTGKTAVKSAIRKYIICKIKKVKAQPPQMSALPQYRIQQQARPFTIVGMDYMGPFLVTVRRSNEKRYSVLFTCLTTRAVHLEVAYSLTTDSCVMAIRRMISRRGQPMEIHSDNGTNLKGAEKELKLSLIELNQTRMKDELEIKGIKWFYSPPSGPHFGGVWERLVRSVKTALYITMKSRAPKDEIFATLMIEAEAIVNARPLVDVPTEPDMPEALTPFHFLIGSSSILHPPGVFEKKEADLGRQWRQSQALITSFWKRWQREYLPILQKRSKWHDETPNLEVGEVVILFDESLRQRSWPLGIITRVFPGDDQRVRVAEIKTTTGIYTRPVIKIGRLGFKRAILD